MTNSIISLCQFVVCGGARAIKSISNGLNFILKSNAIAANSVTYAHTRRHIPYSPLWYRSYSSSFSSCYSFFIRSFVRSPCLCVCLFISSILHLFKLFIESITCCDSLNFFSRSRVWICIGVLCMLLNRCNVFRNSWKVSPLLTYMN